MDDIERMDDLNTQNKIRDCYIELVDKLRRLSKNLATLNKKTKETITPCKARVRVIESCPECKKVKETVYQ